MFILCYVIRLSKGMRWVLYYFDIESEKLLKGVCVCVCVLSEGFGEYLMLKK